MTPTSWTFNPLLPTSNIINYDLSTEPYDNSNQPYDGVVGVAGTVATVVGGKFKMFLGLGFPLTPPGTSKSSPGRAIYSDILWKNPTAYSSSLVAGATITYYGPQGSVPLYAGPTNWFGNETPFNEAGQYEPSDSAYANVRAYDIATLAYDGSTTGYDGMNDDMSFANWKNATQWTPYAGPNDF